MSIHPSLDPPPRRAVNGARSKPGPRLIGESDQVIVDLDGTLIRGNSPMLGAREFLERFEGRYAVVSNNSTDTAGRLRRILGRLGLDVPEDRLVLAGEEMIRYAAREFPGAPCLCATSGILRRLAVNRGLKIGADKPELVLLGRDRAMTYEKLGVLVNAVRRGAKLIVANPDVSHPADGGDVVPETGALMSAVVAGAKSGPHYVVGKPGEGLFKTALDILSSTPSHTVVVGDNPDTDGLGAARLGMDCILIGAEPAAVAPTLAAYLRMIGL